MAFVSESPRLKSDGHQDQAARDSLWHILVVVLTPVAVLLVIVTATLGFTAFARSLTASDGFFVQQQAAMLVVFTGLVLAAIAYSTAIIFALRKIKMWHQANNTRKAMRATWGLSIPALIVSLPLLLAIFFH